jgi:ParB family chromosome partitioning protein
MSKDLKVLLQEKLQQNTQRHMAAGQPIEFAEGREFNLISVDMIDPNPYQPRRIFPQLEIENLASSIAELGLLEPILLRKVNTRYQIAAGERRWRAYKFLNKSSIEAIITQITDSDMAVFSLAENIDREDLSDYEICLALRQIENTFPTKKKLAESLGLIREDMYRYFSFLDLPEFILKSLNDNPRLLSRSAASELKRIQNIEKDSPFLITSMEEAWELLLAGNLEQSKLATYVSKKIKQFTQNEKDCHIQTEHNLIQDGKKVGNIAWTDKHITVKLKSNALSNAQEQKLKIYIENLLNEES